MNLKRLALATAVASLSLLSVSGPARAEENSKGLYLGGLIGYGLPASTEAEVDSGLGYGGTLGWFLMPDLSIAFTYLHDDFATTLGNLDYGIDQYLFEVNSVSLYGVTAGIQAGPVTTKIADVSATDLGIGLHLGRDTPISPNLAMGGAIYWTYIAADDAYSTFNFLASVKLLF